MTLLDATREVCPEAHDVAGWLRLQHNGGNGK
jgi:hypothetical protein